MADARLEIKIDDGGAASPPPPPHSPPTPGSPSPPPAGATVPPPNTVTVWPPPAGMGTWPTGYAGTAHADFAKAPAGGIPSGEPAGGVTTKPLMSGKDAIAEEIAGAFSGMAKGMSEGYFDSLRDSLVTKGKVPGPDIGSNVDAAWKMVQSHGFDKMGDAVDRFVAAVKEAHQLQAAGTAAQKAWMDSLNRAFAAASPSPAPAGSGAESLAKAEPAGSRPGPPTPPPTPKPDSRALTPEEMVDAFGDLFGWDPTGNAATIPTARPAGTLPPGKPAGKRWDDEGPDPDWPRKPAGTPPPAPLGTPPAKPAGRRWDDEGPDPDWPTPKPAGGIASANWSEEARVSAFDRPQPVIVMGPDPLPVKVVEGLTGGGGGAAAAGAAAGEEAIPELAMAKAASDAQKKFADIVIAQARLTGNFYQGVGQAGSATAMNFNRQAGNVATQGVVEGLRKLGTAGQIAGEQINTLAKGFNAASDIVQAFVARGQDLAWYNPSLAMSGAKADIQNTFADMREADDLGDDMAKLSDNLTALNLIVRECLIPIKQWMLDTLNPVVETMLDALEGILKCGNEMAKKWPFSMDDPMGETLRTIRRIRSDMEDGGDIIEGWARAADGFHRP